MLKVGMKLIYTDLYWGEVVDVTTDTIVKENKLTFSTQKKQLFRKQPPDSIFKDNIEFYIRRSYDRKDVRGDVRKYGFHPSSVEPYDKKTYDDYKRQAVEREEALQAREKADKLYKEKRSEAVAPFNELQRELERKAHPLLRKSWIENMCKKCKHFNEAEGTCDRDNDFYKVGPLEKAETPFWSDRGTMCQWQPKDEKGETK